MLTASNRSMEEIISILNTRGYDDVEVKSKRRLTIFVDSQSRVIESINIAATLSGIYDPTPVSKSSIGMIKVDGFEIFVKPKGKQGYFSAGIANEKILETKIGDFLNNE